MAKITGYGFWIDIKSLKSVDKRNWLICLISSGMAGAIAGWYSVSLSTDGIEAFGSMEEQNYIWFAVAEIILIYIAVYTYIQVLKNQDQLFQKYNEMSMIGGALGFILIGIPIAILAPYTGYDVGFIDLFFGFALGACINSFRFYRQYIKEE
jgi:H+/Cl- antiporter ClcA